MVAGRGRREPGTAAGWGDERRGAEAYEREGRQIVVGVALRRIRERESGWWGRGMGRISFALWRCMCGADHAMSSIRVIDPRGVLSICRPPADGKETGH